MASVLQSNNVRAALDLVLDKAVEPARWLLVLAIAGMLAMTVLFFVSPPSTGERPNATVSPGRAADEPVPVEPIINRHLFGVASRAAEAQPEDELIAETRLPLELTGVFESDEPEYSAAIIAERGRPGLLYSLGDTVPGNVKLVEVRSDHVVLERAGIRETLRFPEITSQFASQAADGPDDSYEIDDGVIEEFLQSGEYDMGDDDYAGDDEKQPPPTNVREFVNRYRDRLASEPEDTLQQLGVEPVVGDDGAGGYRLSDLTDSPYLAQTGLQAGDVILSVNGRPVGDVQQDQLELDNILAQGSARLEIQRGTRRFFVTASLR